MNITFRTVDKYMVRVDVERERYAVRTGSTCYFFDDESLPDFIKHPLGLLMFGSKDNTIGIELKVNRMGGGKTPTYHAYDLTFSEDGPMPQPDLFTERMFWIRLDAASFLQLQRATHDTGRQSQSASEESPR